MNSGPKSRVVKRSIMISGHKTSVSLEDEFWRGLKEIARGRGLTLAELGSAIDSQRQSGNLSSNLRLFVLEHYRNRVHSVLQRPDESADVSPDHAAAR
jgi:predicted DNA-binding ribbon-helix-helix protein